MNILRKWRNHQTASDLRAAADLIEEKGWTRGAYIRPEGYCVLGAINSVTTGIALDTFESARRDRAVDALYDLLSPGHTLPTYMISDWNDLPTQTAEMVTSTLRVAATKLLEDKK